MTIAKITGKGYEYLLRHIARGDIDPPARGQDPVAYYTAAGNPPGRWTGRGASRLGLEDGQEVTEDQMRHLFGRGSHPGTGATLGRPFNHYKPTGNHQQKTAVAGFDLVFSPVKSAALLWAVDDRPEVRNAIKHAHEQAVQDALAFIEEHAAHTRAGKNGVAQIDTCGLTAAAFEHWDSRSGDPNLHTHVAVSSKVQGTDGKWRSLDARGLYHLTVAASELYNTAFEARLTAALGVTFTVRPGTAHGKEPVREITGVPPEMTAFFSRRRAAIEARYAELARDYREQHGHDPDLPASHKLARQATLATRDGKKPPVTLPAKRARWQDELTARFGPAALGTLKRAVPGQPRAPVQPVTPDLHNFAERIVASTAAHRSTWTRWHLHAEAERLLRAELPGLAPDRHRDLAEQLIDLALSPKYSLTVEAPSLLNEPSELRRANGESVFTVHGAARFTSQSVLDAEQRLLTAARTPAVNGLTSAGTAASLDGFEAVTGTRLDPGQRALVTAFAADDRLLLAGIGPAGTGKTTAMRAYAHVLRQAGRRLIPLATSAASADVLGQELGLPAENLHKFAYENARARDPRFAIHPGDVLLIDEAGMAGTFLLDQLVSAATANGATVRLLGDHRQLSAVESGGALRLLASEPGTPELTVLHRFRDPREAAATLRLRTGDPVALDWYETHGRIRSGSRDTMTTAAYDGWKTDMLAGKTTMMAAGDGADVTELSARARADRVAAGQVEPGGVTLRDGNRAGAGDWIVTRHNDRRLSACGARDFVKNGDSWTVEHRYTNGALTVRSMAHGGRVTLPPEYVQAHVQLLYASTAHRVQGATVDTAHPLITEGLTREMLYVLATRAREITTFYAATHDVPFDDDARVDQANVGPSARAAREILTAILSTEGAAKSATETIATAQEEAESLSTLVPRYLHAARQHAEPRYRAAANAALGGHLAYTLTRDPSWGSVIHRLQNAEAAGWHPAQLLKIAVETSELDPADSIAGPLTLRIDAILAETPSAPVEMEHWNRPLLPWITSHPPDLNPNGGLPAYLNDAEHLIAARVADLADRAIRERPSWLTALGPEPKNAKNRDRWRHHVGVVAAFRDQYQIATDDPGRPLGPPPSPDPVGNEAYSQSANSVLAARRLTGINQSKPIGEPQYERARGQTGRAPGARRESRRTQVPPQQPPLMMPPPGQGPSGPVPRL